MTAVPALAQTAGAGATAWRGPGRWHLAVWAVVAGLLAWLIVSVTRAEGTSPVHNARPLDQRLARGELTPAEYQERKGAVR